MQICSTCSTWEATSPSSNPLEVRPRPLPPATEVVLDCQDKPLSLPPGGFPLSVLEPKVEDVKAPQAPESSAETPPRRVARPPALLDLNWSEEQEREQRKPSTAGDDAEEDYQKAQKVWMEMLTGRQKHQEDLQAIAREAQLYIFQSIQESYQRQVKVLQKLMQAWQKLLFDWD